jgi:hypothetical protein
MFLTLGQIVRGLATRKFLSNYVSISHRMIFGLNGIGAVVNFLAPFRVGDILRLTLLSKSKLGVKISIYFILVERISDLLIANAIFFILGFFNPSLEFTSINQIGFLLGALGVSIILYGRGVIPDKSGISRTSEFLKSIDMVFGKKQIFLLFASISWSWGLTTCALMILSYDNSGLLQDWVSVNSSYDDPNSMIFEINRVLLVTLIIPLALAFIYSFSLPSPKKLARKTMNDFINEGSKIESVSSFKSSYAGSGASLFQSTVYNSVSKTSEKYLVRVENRSGSDLDASSFMQNAVKAYRFPEALFVRQFARSRCIVLELIIDSGSNAPSKNAFELMIESDRETQVLIIGTLVKHIESFHSKSMSVNPPKIENETKKSLIFDLEKRIQRANAFVFLTLNHLNAEDRRLHSQVSGVKDRLLSGLKTLESEIEIGSSHGDASMSNFLFQDRDETLNVRSIDPNPRFQIGNLEYDLAKVMQSTHALYEFLLTNFASFPADFLSFKSRRLQLGWGEAFDDSITILRSQGKIDENLLDFFFILHLFRIAPYKIHGPSDEFKRYLNVLHWSALDANF